MPVIEEDKDFELVDGQDVGHDSLRSSCDG
jgi:hypothetical protein